MSKDADRDFKIEEHHFTALAEFVEYIDGAPRIRHGIIWRGQSDSTWGITSSAYRHHRYALQAEGDSNFDSETCIALRMETWGPAGFKSVIDQLRTMPVHRQAFGEVLYKDPDRLSRTEQNEIWALGQHYGLKTPLVDWTSSPYAALYFAFADVIERRALSDQGDIAVFGLPCLSAQLFLRKCDPPSDLQIIHPTLAYNDRLLAQEGLFTRLDKPGDLIKRLSESTRDENASGPQYHPELIKLTFPISKALQILQHLYRMNISAKTLFPDLEGVCRFGNSAALDADLTGKIWQNIPWGFSDSNLPGQV